MRHNPPDDEAPETAEVTKTPARLGAEADEISADQDPADVPFTERHRFAVGLVAAALAVGVAVFFAVVGPASAIEPGTYGLIMRWGTPVLWGLLAVVAITWAVRMPKKVTNGLASVVLVAYLVYLIARSL